MVEQLLKNTTLDDFTFRHIYSLIRTNKRIDAGVDTRAIKDGRELEAGQNQRRKSLGLRIKKVEDFKTLLAFIQNITFCKNAEVLRSGFE